MAKKKKQDRPKSAPKHVQPKLSAKDGVSDGIIAWLLAFFGFVLYANTLGHTYVLDDGLAIFLNKNVQLGFSGIANIFSQPSRELCYGGCLYRPIPLMSFAIEWGVAPNSPFIGHLMNVVWYSVTAALLYLTLRKLIPSVNKILLSAAVVLFVAHPVHTEVVANIKSRDEILSLFFIILSLYQYVKWFERGKVNSLVFAGLCFFTALLSKEGAVTAIAVFPLVGWTFFQKSFGSSLKNSGWAVISVALFFLLRSLVLKGLTEPAISMMDNPIVEAHGMQLIGTSLVILSKYFFLLLAPLTLVSDYSYQVIPLQSFGSLGSLTGLFIYGTLAIYAIYALSKRQMTGFFIASFLFSISLYSQIPKILGTMLAERLLYLPSMWFVLGVSRLLTLHETKSDGLSDNNYQNKISSTQRNMLIVSAMITLLFIFQTVKRNSDWASNFKLYQADVAKSPNSVRLNDGYAEELYKSAVDTSLDANEKKQRLDLSQRHSEQSLKIKPGVSAYNNLGNINFTRRNFAEAVVYYQKALDEVESFDIAKRNLVNSFLLWAREEGEKNNNPERARQLLQQALQYDENNSEVWQLIGVSYGVQGNYDEAVKAFEKAYNLSPTNADIKRDLVNTYLHMGLKGKADALK